MKTFHASILYCCGFCVSSCVKYTTQNNTYPMPPTDHGGAWTQVYENPAETLHQPGYRKRAGGDGDAGQAHQSESDIHPGGLNGKRSVALRRTRFQRRLCRLCAGSSNRGASVLLAHDFQFESVVCYTFEGRAPQFASKQTAFVWQRCCACAATLIDAKAATDL